MASSSRTEADWSSSRPGSSAPQHPEDGEPAQEANELISFLEDLGTDALGSGVFNLEFMRMLGCSCHQLRTMMNESRLHRTVLDVQPDDATWGNAVFVTRRLRGTPPLQLLRVAGEQFVPEMDLAKLSSLPKLKAQRSDCRRSACAALASSR